MNKHRLHFSKSGRARYISHLDLMRTFQRAFLRADVAIRQTEGFNRHAFVSIPLPLSVGFSSQCEILDFELVGDIPLEQVPQRMNAALPEGIVVHRCYEAERPIKQLALVEYEIIMEYQDATGMTDNIAELLSRESWVVTKRSKKAKSGETSIDLIPLVKEFSFAAKDNTVTWTVTLAAQNPGLNPQVLLGAITRERPELTPDFVCFQRRRVLDADGNYFE